LGGPACSGSSARPSSTLRTPPLHTSIHPLHLCSNGPVWPGPSQNALCDLRQWSTCRFPRGLLPGCWVSPVRLPDPVGLTYRAMPVVLPLPGHFRLVGLGVLRSARCHPARSAIQPSPGIYDYSLPRGSQRISACKATTRYPRFGRGPFLLLISVKVNIKVTCRNRRPPRRYPRFQAPMPRTDHPPQPRFAALTGGYWLRLAPPAFRSLGLKARPETCPPPAPRRRRSPSEHYRVAADPCTVTA